MTVEANPQTTPSRNLKTPLRRLYLLGGLLGCVWLIIAGRLVTLYFAERDAMQDRLTNQQTTTQTVRARPGDILDRNGRLLATSVDMHSLYAVPREIESIPDFAAAVGPVLELDIDELQAKLERYRDKGFVWLARRIERGQVDAIRQLELPSGTYGFEREFRRHYPQGALAAHVLGLRDIDGVGRGGIEQGWNKTIRGKDGKRVLVRDAHNRVVHLYEAADEPVEHGKTVRLTLDVRLQQIVEEELAAVQEQWQPIGSCAILCDPQTCEILAMASQPSFHPEQPATFRDDAWMNRAIAWTYEPGSTMKPLIVAWAMQQKKVSPQSVFFGHGGAYRMGPRLLHDTHPHGDMSLADVLIQSSNIGMAQIGEQLTNPGLAAGLDHFGFGYRTGVGLAGELPGFVRPLPEWNIYSTGSIPMGQEMMATPLQMLVAHATLANGGHYRQPLLVLDPTEGPAGTQLIDTPVVDRGICRWVVTDPMRRVLTEGTGRRVNVQGLSLFGKTGTSQVYDPEIQAYSNTKTVCSFVCGIPAHDPQLLVIVAVDQPTVGHSHFGSNVAAPAAVEILKRSHPLHARPIARSLVAPIRE